MRIVGIVPAAGASRRLGQDKRLLRHDGQTLVERAVATLLDAGLDAVIVVLEPASPCAGLPGLCLAAVARVVNVDPDRGMLSSVRCALQALAENTDAAAILPADHFNVSADVVRTLAGRFRDLQPLLLVPRYPTRRGHPLFIAAPLFAEAQRCDDTVGLRQLLQRRAADVVEVSLPEADAEQDLDTPDDLSRLRS